MREREQSERWVSERKGIIYNPILNLNLNLNSQCIYDNMNIKVNIIIILYNKRGGDLVVINERGLPAFLKRVLLVHIECGWVGAARATCI